MEVGEVFGFWICFCVWLTGFSNVEGEREKGVGVRDYSEVLEGKKEGWR